MGTTRKPHRNRSKSKPAVVARLLNLKPISDGAPVDRARAAAVASKMPAPPSNLNARGKAYWHFMVEKLADRLEPLDATTLALFCESYAEWQEAGEQLKKQGRLLISKSTGTRYRNPWLDIQKGARKELSSFSALFGLSPHDRARLGIGTGRASTPEENEFDEFRN